MIFLNSTHKTDIKDRIERLNSVFNGARGIYLSGPITTGRKYLNWYCNYGKYIQDNTKYKEEHYSNIIAVNIDKILSFAKELPVAENEIIIEPASFDVNGWTQPDYLYYWGRLIEEYIDKIIFMNEWYYSNGCIYEYYVGLKKGIELVNQDFEPISTEKAISLIQKSIEEYTSNLIDVPFQKELLKEIQKYEYEKKQ